MIDFMKLCLSLPWRDLELTLLNECAELKSPSTSLSQVIARVHIVPHLNGEINQMEH